MKISRHALLYVAVGLAVAFILLAIIVQVRLLVDWDLSTTLQLQSTIPRILDLPFSILSLLGSFEITLLFVIAVLFAFFRPRHALLLLVLFIAIVAIEGSGKFLISQPGPGHDYKRVVAFFRMPSGGIRTPYSFPSGHAARSAYISLVLLAWVGQSGMRLSKKQMLIALIVIAEVVMLTSRVYLGEHWASDVFGGAILGLLCALPALDHNLDRRSAPV